MVVRVLLVEDHAVFRELFASALERELGFEVVARASTLAEARRLLEKDIDVAVVDLSLPDGNGTDLIGELRAENPHAVALVLTASLDLVVYAQAVQTGAAGVLHKSVSVKDLMAAMQRLAAGEALLSQEEVVELLRVADHDSVMRTTYCGTGSSPTRWRRHFRIAAGLVSRLTARPVRVGERW